MAPLPRPTCAVCGAPLPGPLDAIGASARCPKCDTALGPSSEIDEKRPRARPQGDQPGPNQTGSDTWRLPRRPADPSETPQSWPPASDDTLHVPAADDPAQTRARSGETGQTLDFDPTKEIRDAGAEPEYTQLPAGRTHVGRFRVVHVLGRGGFGTVYRAYDP